MFPSKILVVMGMIEERDIAFMHVNKYHVGPPKKR